jgi:hypothetical protein
MRISNSFSEGEIQVLEFIVQTLLRGGTPTMATRHKEFASLCRKVMAMKNKVIEKHEKEQNSAKNSPKENVSEDSEISVEVVGEDSEENLVQVVQ